MGRTESGARAPRRSPTLQRVVLFGVVLVASWLLAYLIVPTVISWLRGSEPEPEPVAAECVGAFKVAVDSATAQDRVQTLAVCTERDWWAQQAITPIEGVTLDSLCAFRGGFPSEACKASDAQRLIDANIAAQKTTTSSPPPPSVEPESLDMGRSSGTGGHVAEVEPNSDTGAATPPRYRPPPVRSDPYPPATDYQPLPPGGSDNGGSQGPSFSPPPTQPPGPSF